MEGIGLFEILAAVATLVCVLVAFFVFQRKSGRNRNTLLLAGPSGGGKTLLFVQLTRGTFVETHTSMDENVGSVSREKGGLTLVDVPGHERLRGSSLEKHVNDTRGVVFVVDSAKIGKEDILKAAQYLFDLLSKPALKGIKILLFFNKQDTASARSATAVVDALQKELTSIRDSSAGSTPMLMTTDPKAAAALPLPVGEPGQPITLSAMSRITVASGSARGALVPGTDRREPQLAELKTWLDTL
eukprot:m.230605 g.230605  ORF g.230605 m.230605 type:complete len:244 (-) comp18097_c0_seq1:30-761(-)